MPQPPPNILWICTDQQRFDTIGTLGNLYVRTPNLDRLASEGVAFTHAFCQSPICTPSRASFLTGLYPSTIHACMNGNEYWSDSAPLVTKRLADIGYRCGLVGKLHLSTCFHGLEHRPDDGYQVFHWSPQPVDKWTTGHAYADWLSNQGYHLHEHQKDLRNIPVELHQTTWCTDQAIAFIKESEERPWLLSWNCFDPHSPFDPPREYRLHFDADKLPGPLCEERDIKNQDLLREVDFQKFLCDPKIARERKADYYAMIELIDANVGRMWDALSATNQLENTIIIFMSDHGEMLGDHGLLLKGCRFYEGLVRVPLIITWPGHYITNVQSHALVELTDIVPTLLESIGLAVPKVDNMVEYARLAPGDRIQGRSLLPILTGHSDPHQHRQYVRCEYYNALEMIGTELQFEGSYGTMYRDNHYKLCVYHGHDMGELYDLQLDPNEFHNLWCDPAYVELKVSLMKRSFDATAFAVDIGPSRTGRF